MEQLIYKVLSDTYKNFNSVKHYNHIRCTWDCPKGEQVDMQVHICEDKKIVKRIGIKKGSSVEAQHLAAYINAILIPPKPIHL